MYGSGEVEEITGLSSAAYEYSDNNFLMDELDDGSPKVKSRSLVTFSKDLRFMVCLSDISTTSTPEYVIESFPVSESGIYIMADISTTEGIKYRKYRYTLEELGIGSDETIREIALGCAGLFGRPNNCLLIIATNLHTHFYTYHLSDNGQIGRVYETETDVIENFVTDAIDGSYTGIHAYTSNQVPNIFYTVRATYGIGDYRYYFAKNTLTRLANSGFYLSKEESEGYTSDTIGLYRQNYGTYITKDDRFIIGNRGGFTSYRGFIAQINNENHNIVHFSLYR